MMEIPKFGDFVKNKPLEGDKIKIDDVLGKPVVVTGCAVTKSKYTNKGSGFLTRIQIYFEDDKEQKRYVIFTGSEVIKNQIEEITEKLEEEGLPLLFKTTINDIGNYSCLT